MTVKDIILCARPAWIIKMFWLEQIVVEENAVLLEPIYLQEVA